jgi:hypothetical protein
MAPAAKVSERRKQRRVGREEVMRKTTAEVDERNGKWMIRESGYWRIFRFVSVWKKNYVTC